MKDISNTVKTITFNINLNIDANKLYDGTVQDEDLQDALLHALGLSSKPLTDLTVNALTCALLGTELKNHAEVTDENPAKGMKLTVGVGVEFGDWAEGV